MTPRIHKISQFVLSVVFVATMGLFSGCKPYQLITGVGFIVEPNLETIKVQMDFSPDIQSDLGGTYPVKDYGTIEIEPSSSTHPFNVGFRLNTEVFNDQDFVHFEPTFTLPSGQRIPLDLNRALAQVSLKKSPSDKFEVYVYVDVIKAEWIGVAVTMNFLNEKTFPIGVAISQQFIRGRDGTMRTAGSVFGPKLDANGSMRVPGGFALFANVRGLIDDVRGVSNMAVYDAHARSLFFDGPAAPHYRKKPRDAVYIGEAFKALMKMHARP